MRILPLAVLLPVVVLANADNSVDEIVVTSSRAPAALARHIGNISVLDRSLIEATGHIHIHELMTRAAGVWIVRGSGQESLPSIRSPVLTGPGSCGAFLTLEDGVPIRPSGFCNVNQMFELNTELADAIEVIRGPGNALYGSNALHGTVNVLLPEPLADSGLRGGVEFGPNDFVRLQGALNTDGTAPIAMGGTIADDSGFRDDTGYRDFKGYARKSWMVGGAELTAGISLSDLAQETAGFIVGEDAYKDPDLNRRNFNPEAYRDASSQRLVFRWRRPTNKVDLDIRPYLRHSDMEFLQHFLPGQPLEENGHVSFGVLASARRELDDATLIFGTDLEFADIYLRQTQFGATEGSEFLQETRPEGKHYDYDVVSLGAAAYVQAEHRLSPQLSVSGGLRAEFVRYDYRNKMLTGNTRDDGTACGFGGCLYSRPADREDSFSDLAPKLGLLLRLTDDSILYANLARGFRAPQMTELYRLQSGQSVADIDSEVIDAAEIGWRSSDDHWNADVAVFAMRKKNSVYRDADGFNVSGGRSRHLGLEVTTDVALHPAWTLTLTGTWARHSYDFNAVAARGETFVSGRDVDTAPRWQGSAELRYQGSARIDAALQWVSLGEHYLDAENQHTYPGHDIANLRINYAVTDRWSMTFRLNNITDIAYADRADFAFGDYRYFPGRGRELYVALRYARGN